MKNAFIIHGSYGSPDENWFKWLKNELEKIGFAVYLPKFPTPQNQNIENWFKVFQKYEQYLDEDSIMIGHSLGPAFILNLLEKIEKKIYTSFFVSGFIGQLNNLDFDEINKSFADKVFDWNKIKESCKRFILFHSDNDPYIPLNKAEELKEKLDAELIVVKDAGHFNTVSGYDKFEELLEKIKNN
ncbi:MAG: serine hydrolase family protein [Nanoarchaeota archaeon]|nr:serine hydrolase family protein [Nanoarchaeota archaeon]